MMIQEEKVEIVEDEKPKALQNQKTNDVQKPEDVIPETRKKSTLLYVFIFIASLLSIGYMSIVLSFFIIRVSRPIWYSWSIFLEYEKRTRLLLLNSYS